MLDILGTTDPMKRLKSALFRFMLFCLALCALFLATDSGLIPSGLHWDSTLFHWQVWFLLGILVFTGRNRLSEARCRCCGAEEDLTFLGLLSPSRELLCHRCLNWDLEESAASPLGFLDIRRHLRELPGLLAPRIRVVVRYRSAPASSLIGLREFLEAEDVRSVA